MNRSAMSKVQRYEFNHNKSQIDWQLFAQDERVSLFE